MSQKSIFVHATLFAFANQEKPPKRNTEIQDHPITQAIFVNVMSSRLKDLERNSKNAIRVHTSLLAQRQHALLVTNQRSLPNVNAA